MIVVNKFFEAEPLMAVLAHVDARPPSLDGVKLVAWPRPKPKGWNDVVLAPRGVVSISGWTCEIWCIQDLMDPGQSSSNTKEKVRALKSIFGFGAQPDLVVAFGTAATPEADSFNGTVSVGTRCFLFNPYTDNPGGSPSDWSFPGGMECDLPSALGRAPFDAIANDAAIVSEITKRLVPEPNACAPRLLPRLVYDAVSLSSVNVVDHNRYDEFDELALASAHRAVVAPVLSIETTHGVIRAQSSAPFLFISGIANRKGKFGNENKSAYNQNFAAAHNAAIACAWLVPALIRALDKIGRD